MLAEAHRQAAEDIEKTILPLQATSYAARVVIEGAWGTALRKMKKEIVFFRSQMWKSPNGAGCTFDAEISEGREGFLVHHNRSYMWEHRSQAGQNLEALRVQVTPVENGALGQPRDTTQLMHHEAATEKREGVPLEWQREKGHLVFADDAALHA